MRVAKTPSGVGLEPLECVAELPGELRWLLARAHVDHARLAGDHEAGGDDIGSEEPRHLADVRALSSEEVAHLA